MILGITGKSGTGKHTAAKFLEQKGWKILDADTIAHRLYRPYQRLWRRLVDHFGEGILTKDDTIDRQKLKKIIFGAGETSDKARRELNAIIHPELRRHLKDELYYLRRKKAKAALVAALWEELGLFELCDKVLVITAGEALAYERIRKRDGTDFGTYEDVTKNQSKPKHADFIVENEGSFQDFYKKLNSILAQL